MSSLLFTQSHHLDHLVEKGFYKVESLPKLMQLVEGNEHSVLVLDENLSSQLAYRFLDWMASIESRLQIYLLTQKNVKDLIKFLPKSVFYKVLQKGCADCQVEDFPEGQAPELFAKNPVQFFAEQINEGQQQNYLIYGSSGVGKTDLLKNHVQGHYCQALAFQKSSLIELLTEKQEFVLCIDDWHELSEDDKMGLFNWSVSGVFQNEDLRLEVPLRLVVTRLNLQLSLLDQFLFFGGILKAPLSFESVQTKRNLLKWGLKQKKINKLIAKDVFDSLISLKWGNGFKDFYNFTQILQNCSSSFVQLKDLPQDLLVSSLKIQSEPDLTDVSYNDAKKLVLNKFSTDYIAKLLNKSDNNLTVAAEWAGMDRSNFKKLMKKFDVGE